MTSCERGQWPICRLITPLALTSFLYCSVSMTSFHLQMLSDLATSLALLPFLLSHMSKRDEWNCWSA